MIAFAAGVRVIVALVIGLAVISRIGGIIDGYSST